MKMPSKIGKYQVKGLLGRGGMGVVYRCYDEAIDRHVAVKAITKSALEPDDLKHAIARFRHEAKAVGRLIHPAIVQIYDYAENDEIAYIVMEMVTGRTLQEYLKAGEIFELKRGANIVRQVLDGIGHAHSQGVIHRDIKPSNILLTDTDAVKIADFGIARTEASSLTQVGDIIGTLYYMAPEQFLGGAITNATDVYSIGVIAYEVLTGRRPFVGNNAQVMQKVLNEVPENPSMLNLALSPAVDRVVQRALAKKPKDRYQNTEEFARELAAVSDSAPAASGIGGLSLSSGDDTSSFYTSRQSVPLPSINTEQTKPAQTKPVQPQTGASAGAGAAILQAARMLGAGAPPAAAPESTRAPAPPAAPLDPGADSVSGPLTLDNTGSAISLDSSVRKARVLFVDDDPRILSALKSLFRERYHVFATTDCEKALDFIGKYSMHVVVSDQRMPQMIGVEFLRRTREIAPNAVRILLTGYSDLAAIVGSINDGEVYRFISKPWDNEELKLVMGEAVTIGLELANTSSVDTTLPKEIDAGVMVIDQNEDMFRVVTELFGKTCPVMYAGTVDAAVAKMQQQDVAVVITDVDFAQDELTSMLKLLKQENPQILTIVVTSASDSEMVIDLINEAQVFRFLNKPVNVNLMRTHIQAALKRYIAFGNVPALTKAQQVQVAGEIRESEFGKDVVKKLGGARERWRARAAEAAKRRSVAMQSNRVR
jgi:serine/threonine-protein kinase